MGRRANAAPQEGAVPVDLGGHPQHRLTSLLSWSAMPHDQVVLSVPKRATFGISSSSLGLLQHGRGSVYLVCKALSVEFRHHQARPTERANVVMEAQLSWNGRGKHLAS